MLTPVPTDVPTRMPTIVPTVSTGRMHRLAPDIFAVSIRCLPMPTGFSATTGICLVGCWYWFLSPVRGATVVETSFGEAETRESSLALARISEPLASGLSAKAAGRRSPSVGTRATDRDGRRRNSGGQQPQTRGARPRGVPRGRLRFRVVARCPAPAQITEHPCGLSNSRAVR